MLNNKRASVVLLSTIFIASMILNTIACYIIAYKVKRKKLTHWVVISISIANLLETIIGLIPEIVMSDKPLLKKTPLCVTGSYAVFGLSIASITHLLVLSLIRTAAIKYPIFWRHFYLKISSKVWCKATLILFCYSYGFSWATFPVFGWSKYEIDLNKKHCSLDWKLTQSNSLSYILTILIFCSIFPGLVITCASYICKKAITQQKTSYIRNKNSRPMYTLKKEHLRVCFLSALLFFVTWTPYTVVGVFTLFRIIIPMELVTIASLFSKLSTISNVLINCFINKSFRKHLLNLRLVRLVVNK
ncbi:opsin-3 [Hydra vulgaris]|uniref:Opsin-3 n=1 Tax=Hydra vulgaris TaxID=6087 RepID=A0ABM4DAF4_HYDVU